MVVYNRDEPHILAIIYDKEETDSCGTHRCVRDIMNVKGCDKNARRRLFAQVRRMHGQQLKWIGDVVFETYFGNGGCVKEDVTKKIKRGHA